MSKPHHVPTPSPSDIPSPPLPRRVIDLLAAGVTRLIDAPSAGEGADIEHAGPLAPRLELSPHGGLSVVPTGERHRRGTESGGPGTPENPIARHHP